MKTFNLFLILLISLSIRAQAEKMDSETQNLVIERLERIIGLMEKKDSSWVPTNLRLADLLSERARLRFMNEVEVNCQGCKGSVEDRKRALSMYEGILKTARPEMKAPIFFQMGHLYQIGGNSDKAASLFQSVLSDKSKNPNPDLIRRARTSLADLEFERGHHKDALKHYNLALKDPKTANKGLILYRRAWCEFNLDQLPKAIRTLENLAQSPDLLVKETAQGTVRDEGFQADVLRDLATFYSRQKITPNEIAKYQKLIPDTQRKDLLFFFAGESGRLGQKKAAADIYKAYLKTPGLTKTEQMEVMVLLAQTEYDKNGSTESIESFAIAAQAYKQMNCDDDEKCKELHQKMKHYVTEIHRSRKTNPDANVLKAYEIYVQTFPKDTEMSMLGAQVAVQLNKSETATRLYSQSADTASDSGLRETALLGEISSAEKTHDPVLRENAYNHYIALNPKGEKSFEVRYQLAHLSYEKKNYDKAAQQFKELALDLKGPEALRKSSADLALDSLAIQKRDSDIEKWAQDFSVAFPKNRVEFDRISRKAIMNQVVVTTNNQKSSTRELEKALEKLQQTNLSTANETEQILHFRNMLILAEKVDSEKSLRLAIAGLLRIKSLQAKDREETLARAVGFYERKLDFKTAYAFAVQMKFPGLRKADKELRLGTLADLANLPAQRHYQSALNLGISKSAEASVRERLVLLSARPSRELIKHQDRLLSSPEILNETILIIFAKEGLNLGLSKTVNNRRFSHLSSVRFIQKQAFYQKHQKFDQKISRHVLITSSDRLLQKSIKERFKLLSAADQTLAEANEIRDTTAQIMALTTMVRENQRLANNLMQTPMPKGLNAVEQKKYQQLLVQQTRPYVSKANLAQNKLQSLWNNERFFIGLISDYEKSRAEIQRLLKGEIQTLAALAPNRNLQNRLNSALRDDAPSLQELMAARASVRENPENLQQIEKLKNLETKIGHPLMSPYLQGRLVQIQKEKVL
ncbi:MAG: tol-pal system YbgF family protein [Pseudobdellovibrionaceae bacterium]